MSKYKHRFESEVHLGLLAIILILLLLCVAANYTVSKARQFRREATLARLNSAALVVTRQMQGKMNRPMAIEEELQLESNLGLSGLFLVPSVPPEGDQRSRREWFVSVVPQLPPGQLPRLAHKLIRAKLRTLTRGREAEYFYIYPFVSSVGEQLLVLATEEPEMAYLDDTGQYVLYVTLISLAVVTAIYLLMARLIFSPYRRIRRQALDAGRKVEGTDEVEAVVDDYRLVIEELRKKEVELLILNEAIQRKADSLESFNKYLLRSIDTGIITFDRNGKLLTVNEPATLILGVEASQWFGRKYMEIDVLSGELGDDLTEVFHSTSEGIPYRETLLTTSEGKELALGISISTIYDNTEKAIGVSLLINDLSELVALRRELETKNRLVALGEMSGGLAHQLRNSLGAIVGYATLTKRKLTGEGPAKDCIGELTQEANQAEALIERFLSFTRPFHCTLQPTLLGKVIDDVVKGMQVRPDCSKLIFVVENFVGNEVDLDRLLLKQAVANIVENAAAAYPDRDGIIEIRTRQDSKGISIGIEDFGCGIPLQDREKIFTPFFSSRPSGTGLGLPLAARIVDLHGGKLTVDSTVGKGTTFTILLPGRCDMQEAQRAVVTGIHVTT